jgi:opine dehydrogenase
MQISQLLDPRYVLTGISAKSKDAALTELVSALGAARGLDASMALRDIYARERAGTTLLPLGPYRVAVPHAATTACRQLLFAMGTSREGVKWDDGPEGRAHLIVVLLGPPQTRGLYLRVLSRIARLCAQKGVVQALLDAATPEQLIERLATVEQPLGEIVAVDGMPSFCVLGAGPGGLAMAGHLALTGCKVNLFTRNEERLRPLVAGGGISVTGEVHGLATLNQVTTNVAEAIRDVDVLMVVVPATAHRNIANLIAPHIKDGQIMMLNPGRTGGALEVAQVLKVRNPAVRPYLAEAQTLLYASRLTNPGQVHVFGVKSSVPVAALPSYQIADILPVIQSALPQFVPGDNVLKTSLDNIGAVFHPAITVLNAGRIEDTHGDFEYYTRGVTPAIASVLEAIDRERIAVTSALGIRAHTAREWLYLAYNAAGKTLLDAMQANPGYRGIKAVATLQHRYIAEDVPMSLVPIASIGQMLGVPTPTIRAVIHLACIMHDVDYWAEGRTVQRLGIAGMSVKDIRLLVVGAESAASVASPPPSKPPVNDTSHDEEPRKTVAKTHEEFHTYEE